MYMCWALTNSLVGPRLKRIATFFSAYLLNPKIHTHTTSVCMNIPYSGNLLQMETFTNCWGVRFLQLKLMNCGKQVHPKRIFVVKTSEYCHKTVKFTKAFIRERFPLHSITLSCLFSNVCFNLTEFVCIPGLIFNNPSFSNPLITFRRLYFCNTITWSCFHTFQCTWLAYYLKWLMGFALRGNASYMWTAYM